MSTPPKALFVLNTDAFTHVYASVYPEIAQLVNLIAPPQTAQSIAAQPELLHDAEIIFSGWGSPPLNADLLTHAPNLKIVFHGAGSIKHLVSPAFWQRGIIITSAAAANALPVAEFTLAQILLCLKNVWQSAHAVRAAKSFTRDIAIYGAYGSSVGLISLGLIARRVIELLKPFDLTVLAYDPYVSAAQAAELNVKLVSLDEIFQQSQVVSLHTPWLPQTVGLITGAHLRQMPPNSAFINTARGAVVREAEMLDVLTERPDITAVLDVTYPEPPPPDSPLYTLPNVLLTPHIAGALGNERRRLGEAVLEELKRYLAGMPQLYPVTREQSELMA
jgi:phosphoglycerate dehydrogenase-like enzyme